MVAPGGGQRRQERDPVRDQRAQVALGDERRVAAEQELRAAERRLEVLQCLADDGRLVARPLLGAVIERHALLGDGLAELGLAQVALLVGGVPEADQRRAAMRAAHRHRGEVPVQPLGLAAEALERAQAQRPLDLVDRARERVQRAPQAIVVQERRRRAEQRVRALLVGPAADVVERARVAEAVGDQRADHLAMGELRAPTRGQRPVDRLRQPQPPQVAGDQRQRPATPARALRRRVKARERGRQAIQLPRALQLLAPAQVCHDTLAHPAALVAVALNQLHVDVAAPSAPDGRLLEEHIATTLSAHPDESKAEYRPKFAITTPGTRNPPFAGGNRHLPPLNRGRRA